jgi:uncharacterized protein (TIGR02266 family)
MTSDDAGNADASRPRVVRLKLRYKSATVDEFIEKYALDVSPRGIYVNIARPLAVGTLVKLEIRLASEQVIIKGAGTVVWNRDRELASGTRPAGLWIKFIQIDEPSKAFIEKVASARADAGMAYEEQAEKEADAPIVESPGQSVQQATALPAAAAPKLRATLVGITAPAMPPARPRLSSLPPIPTPPPPRAASLPPVPVPVPPRLKATLTGITTPATLPPRPRLASLPPIPTPPPPKAASLPPPPGKAFEEQAETDADEATVVWDEAPAAPTQEAILIELTAPATLPALLRPASLPPIPTPPPPKAVSALPVPALPYEEPSEKDAEDDTVIWDHEPSHQIGSASLVPVASAPPAIATAQQGSARELSVKTTVTRRRSTSPFELPQWARSGAWVALGFFATVALALAVRSTRWFRSLTTAEVAPVIVGGEATSGATAMTSAETAPVLDRPTAEAPLDAAPAATTPVEATGVPPMTSTSPQAIVVPVPAPTPKPTPAARPTSPVPMGLPTVRAKPKPKPAPTIDDGF